ncbi:hypothetical protein LguiA_010748 [Lonicera macranthoides]
MLELFKFYSVVQPVEIGGCKTIVLATLSTSDGMQHLQSEQWLGVLRLAPRTKEDEAAKSVFPFLQMVSLQSDLTENFLEFIDKGGRVRGSFKYITVQSLTKEGLRKLGPYMATMAMAEVEGLEAHKRTKTLSLQDIQTAAAAAK